MALEIHETVRASQERAQSPRWKDAQSRPQSSKHVPCVGVSVGGSVGREVDVGMGEGRGEAVGLKVGASAAQNAAWAVA